MMSQVLQDLRYPVSVPPSKDGARFDRPFSVFTRDAQRAYGWCTCFV